MKKIMLILITGLFLISLTFISAWSTNTFNNSLSEENLTFSGNENITRWLSVPENILLTGGFLNLTTIFETDFTNVGHIDNGGTGSQTVWGDGTYIYLANYDDGLREIGRASCRERV